MPILEFIGDQSAIRRLLRAIVRALAFKRPGARRNAPAEPCVAPSIRRRLTEGKSCLERLDAERQHRGDSRFGKATEDRIVWGELIELELQEIDEQVSRICDAAGREAPGAGRPSLEFRPRLREGGSHERNGS